jgi:predicted aspartyl protease
MRNQYFLLVALTLMSFTSIAGPIRGIHFYYGYNEIPEIFIAQETQIINYEAAAFLSSTSISIDKKVALINAIAHRYDTDVKGNNKKAYEKFLKNKYKVQILDLNKITADEQLCIGYLGTTDDDFNLEENLGIIKNAVKRNPQSFTYNIVYGLTLSQLIFNKIQKNKTININYIDYRFIDSTVTFDCNRFLICAKIESDVSLKQDFRMTAKRIIFEYLNDYKNECSSEDLVLIPATYKVEKLTTNRFKLIKKNGLYKIPVQINGSITMDFIFDSDASDVFIPSDVFSVLVKQGKIAKEDLTGVEQYQIADGSITKNISIVLRKMQIGEVVVTNVKASVGKSNTPLLLGQSFMQKFSQLTIDNENGYLTINLK